MMQKDGQNFRSTPTFVSDGDAHAGSLDYLSFPAGQQMPYRNCYFPEAVRAVVRLGADGWG
jgi:hypothetical protein